ncbi:HutD family protein [Arthrobacter sp. H14-L1]|uniref:HutD/Ves family protein n=1 Tax=Arthrobacter sp. H14-L1 TaxID=2996697 RepID=UPI0022719C49|nr:HutD family protein [Arthrobacter sp. H14-L1]MCY0905548.1 HutD family protein [Arthrobacter sp. H14-L1]
MQVIRYSQLSPERWANGDGVTRTLAAQKAADGDGCLWRISIAEVSTAGPFSAMPGIDRIVTVIDGELLLLEVDGSEHLLEKYRPFRFSGDSSTSASLPTGNVMDLGVLARRRNIKAYTTVVELSKKRPHPVFADQFAVLLQGQATVSEGAVPGVTAAAAGGVGAAEVASGQDVGTVALSRFDAVAGSDAAPELTGRGFVAIVSIGAAQ